MITHDSWQRIKEIFQSAQSLSGAERSDFLDKACGDDPSLREEVEALLTADASNEDFLNAPAYEFAASILVESEFVAGQKIGPYTVLCPLGAGGMGQIYLAEDVKLRRKIALKLISPQFASDPRRVSRFEQEALAASALNHPNICVIHELGTTDSGRHFIAMEYIQGITLREKLSHGPLLIPQALNIAIQVATALSSAHASGIVHRDIKPENIMVRPDGYVKVLDFGLAKLTEILPDQSDLREGSTGVHTEAGTLMGTVKYMSPEQLGETKVDERSDIWSLGVVLYEMLTGSTPFEAPTANETVAAIRAGQSTPLKFTDQIPSQLRDIVSKALEKDRDLRYQTVSKLAADLKKLPGELQLHPTVDSLPVYSYRGDEQRTRKIESSGIFNRIKTQAVLRTDFLLSEIRTHKKAAIFTGVSGVLVLLVFLPTLVSFISGIGDQDDAISPTKMEQVTYEGTSVCSAFSSDGKLIAHAEERDGKQRIVITNTETSVSAVVVPPAEVQYLGVSFTRDRHYLYVARKENGAGILYRLALSGGSLLKIKDEVDSPISFSPQQDRFAFVRLDRTTGVYSLIISNIDGSGEQILATRGDGHTFSVYGLAWSPDGNLVVCPSSSWTDDGYKTNLVGIDLKSGREQTIGHQWFAILQIAWHEDMSSLVLSAKDQGARPFQLWRVTYPDGVSRQITGDPGDYQGVSLSGQKIVSVRVERTWELYVAKAADNFETHSAILSGVGLSYGLNWAGDERIVFSSMAQNNLNVSRIDADGSNQVQLTSNAEENYTPATSADGQFTVFASNRTGKFNIWRMNTQDGSDLKQLTFSDSNFYPVVSPDNQWIAYDNQIKTTLSVWKVPLQGGNSEKLVDRYRMPTFSPDGQYLATRYDAESGTNDVAIISVQDGQIMQKVPVPNLEWQSVQWLSNRTLTFVKSVGGHSEIWSYDLDTGATKQLTNFKRKQIFAYAWSPDRTSLACQLGNGISNVVTGKSEQ